MTHQLHDDSMSAKALFFAGAKKCIPVCLAAGPFGALFGALAVDGGMTISEAVLMSLTIFAGASQMVGIDLFGQAIPAWVIVLSIFAVNFRHVLYSASIGRHLRHWTVWQRIIGFHFLVDPQYAESEARVERGKKIDFAWYMGLALPVWFCWVFITWIGAIFGNLLKDSHTYGIDFLLPIYFLGLVMGFRKRSFWLPVVGTSAIAAIIAYETVGSPWQVSIGAVAGILLAAFFSPQARGKSAGSKEMQEEGV